MARIRTIKPEFWTDEKVLSINPLTRLLFIGMWNFADDYGRLEFSPISLKAKIFPGDHMTADDVKAMLHELSGADLLLVYSAKAKEYIEITGWHNQKIDKRQSSKIPGPYDQDSEIRRAPPTSADLPRPTPTSAPVMEGKGMERKGKDSEANASGADAPPDPAIPEKEYFLRGREVLGPKSGAMIANLLKAKGKNVALARAALEQASTKQNPLEFVAAICRGPPPAKASTVHQQRQAEGRAILDELHEFNTGTGSRTNPGLLRHDPGDGAESLRGRAGGNLIEISSSGD